MIQYIYEYMSTGDIYGTRYYDAPSVPSQTLRDPSHAFHVVTIDGTETQDAMTDLNIARNDPDNHKIKSAAIKRLDLAWPDSLIAQAGFSPIGTLLDFQLGGALATATDNNTATTCHVSLPTPAMNPYVGIDEQVIAVEVEPFDVGQTGTPTVRIEVWESGGGSALAASAEIDVIAASAVASFIWDAGVLGEADGSALEIKIFGTPSGGAASARNSLNIGAISWRCLRDTFV